MQAARELLDDGEMKRDMDMIRNLLLAIEDDERLDGTKSIRLSSWEPGLQMAAGSHSIEHVRYNLRLLIEAAFVDGTIKVSDGPAVRKLSWAGHEFAASVRDESVWGRTKKRLDGLPSVAVSVIAEIAKAEVRKHLGLP